MQDLYIGQMAGEGAIRVDSQKLSHCEKKTQNTFLAKNNKYLICYVYKCWIVFCFQNTYQEE